jgi:hypothetical protein
MVNRNNDPMAGYDVHADVNMAAFDGQSVYDRHGTVIDDPNVSAAAVLRAANLHDLQVEKRQATCTANDGETLVNMPDRFATWARRTDTYMGNVGRIYRCWQYEDVLDVLDAMVGDRVERYTNVATVGNGARAMITVKLRDDITMNGRDVSHQYLTAISGHDGGVSLSFLAHTSRPWCGNVFPMILREAATAGTVLRFRHSGSLAKKQAIAVAAFTKAQEDLKAYALDLEAMHAVKATAAHVEAFVKVLVPDVEEGKNNTRRLKKRAQILHLHNHHHSNTHPAVRGTVAAAFQAAVQWADWVHVRGKGSEQQFKSALFGSGAKFKRAARAAALELVNDLRN